MQIIGKGKTHVALDKFKATKPEEWTRTGCDHTEYEDDGVKHLTLDTVPSYKHKDNHILCAGNNTHWTNASTLHEWVRQVRCCYSLLLEAVACPLCVTVCLVVWQACRVLHATSSLACRLRGHCTFNAPRILGKNAASYTLMLILCILQNCSETGYMMNTRDC